MASISDIPIEIFLRIVEMGCLRISPQPKRIYALRPRRLKGFATAVALVCRRWKTSVYSRPRNFHATICIYVETISQRLVEVSATLSDSDGCDIEISFHLEQVEEPHLQGSLVAPNEELAINLITHTLVGYRRQIRRLDIVMPPIQAFFSAMQSLIPLPNVEVLNMELTYTRRTRFYQEHWRTDPTNMLSDTMCGPLDLSLALNCHWACFTYVPAIRYIIFPPSGSVTLVGSDVANIRWQDLTTVFRESRHHYLKFDPLSTADLPPSNSISQHSMQHLRILHIETDIITLCSLVTFFYMPSLQELEGTLRDTPQMISQHRAEMENCLSNAVVPRLPLLSELTLHIYNPWSRLHDLFVTGVLPGYVTCVKLSGYIACVELGDRPSTSAPPIVASLSLPFRFDLLLAVRWNPVRIIIRKVCFFSIPPESKVVSFSELRSITISECRLSQLNTLLRKTQAPRLEEIHFSCAANYLLCDVPHTTPSRLRKGYEAVKSLTILYWSKPTVNGLKKLTKSFPNLYRFHLTVNITRIPVLSHWEPFLQAIEGLSDRRALKHLTVAFVFEGNRISHLQIDDTTRTLFRSALVGHLMRARERTVDQQKPLSIVFEEKSRYRFRRYYDDDRTIFSWRSGEQPQKFPISAPSSLFEEAIDWDDGL
jgi:hypothetical protein